MAFPFLALAVGASAGLSAFGQIRAGQAADLASRQQADQMEIDREVNSLQASQVQNQRLRDYSEAQASNDAMFSFMLGGGESTSRDAFEEAQRRTVGEDIQAGQLQASLERSNMTVGSMLERQRGRNAKTVSQINALSSIIGGAGRAYKVY